MRILAAVFFTLASALPTFAQAQDFPVRVGRIAHIEGRASLYQDPESGWESAYVNSPVTSENSVWTDEGSRAEVRVSGVAVRLDYLTQLDVARLDEDELDAFVARGSVAVRVRHHQANERLVFNTPNTSIRLRADGRYRIDVDPERFETHVTVFAGEAAIGTDDGRVRLSAGRSMVVFGADPPQFVEERVQTVAFDRWTQARDERWREGRAPTYVSTYMTGYEELDSYGQWVTEPDYGVLWYPRQVSADWAPYRYGRWDYVQPWGWTWIDDAPWGYAPFHYGRWVYVRDRWGWLPGERVARPVWAPALVAWVGGSNWSVGVSSGGPSLGWYPLSPWDRYDPWFRASPTYVQRVNVVVRPEPSRPDRRQWREWTRERGMTVVDRRVVVDQQPVHRALQPVPNDVIRQARAVPRPEAVLPSRNDVIERRRERPQQAAPAPRVIAQQRAQPGAQAPSQPAAIVRPNFGRNAVAATPRQSNEQERQAQRQQAQRQVGERQAREQQQAQERAQREQQQGQQRAQREQEQAQRQAQERAQREQQQGQQREQEQAQRQAQERAQREQQQGQQRAQREQEQAQRQAQERAQREQQQAQQQAQERAQREQQQAQQRAQREQEQAQRQAQERAQREQQQAQQRTQREQEQAQRQAQERAQREQQQAQQQAQQRAQREQQQAQQQAQQRAQREQEQAQRQAQERAQREQQQAQQQAQQRAQREQQQAQQRQQQRGKDKEKDDDDDKGKGKGNKP